MYQFIDPANVVTLLGLWLGLGTALAAAVGRLELALGALVAAGVADLLDGLVARRMGRTRSEEARRFGARLDSLADACSFGMAPALLLHAALPGLAGWGIPLLLLTCAVWRLAYFDTVGLAGEGQARYYIGLPTTYAALFFPLAGLSGHWGPEFLRAMLLGTGIVLAALMVTPIRIRKPWGPWYPALFTLAAVLLGTYAWLGIRGGFAGALSG